MCEHGVGGRREKGGGREGGVEREREQRSVIH